MRTFVCDIGALIFIIALVVKIFIFYIMALIGFRESQTTSLVNKHMLSLYFHLRAIVVITLEINLE